jgi:aconitate hydratase
MDARSIAATAANGGRITPATELDLEYALPAESFNGSCYERRVYNGFGKPLPETELKFGPNIANWPRFESLPEHLLLKLCAVLRDEVTTTDELIPSGETSSFRSNPERLSSFALSRRAPNYVPLSKAVRSSEEQRREGTLTPELENIFEEIIKVHPQVTAENTGYYSCIYANKPGDGSAREQAASCQRVLGGLANICRDFATKRYRSNCINWGILPFTIEEAFVAEEGDCIFIPNIREQLSNGSLVLTAEILREATKHQPIILHLNKLSDEERAILIAGCLMNYYANEE